MVLLPLPLRPTMPILLPASISKLKFFKTKFEVGVYLKLTLSNLILPFILFKLIGLSLVCSVGVFSISPNLSTLKIACCKSFQRPTSLITGALNCPANI